MYNDMLNEAVRALKAGVEPDLDAPFSAGCEVNLHAPALLPADYCGDIPARLSLYKRLSSTADEDNLIRIQEELIDRFGKLPDPARTLIATHKLRLLGLPLGIQKIDASEGQINLQFKQNTTVDPMRLIELVQKQKHIRFAGPDKLRIELQTSDVTERFEAVRTVLRSLV
jgi:transcription-repair coupling factor (superfamily II helicase)